MPKFSEDAAKDDSETAARGRKTKLLLATEAGCRRPSEAGHDEELRSASVVSDEPPRAKPLA